jgi:AraC family transcriptional regulator
MAIAIDEGPLGRILEEELGGHLVEFSPVADTSDEIVRRMLVHLKNELTMECPGGRLYGESILVALVSHTIPRYGTIRPVLKQYRRGLSTTRLRRVLDYIDAYLDTSLGVAELASIAGLSPYHFGKLFRGSMGRSVHQYVLDCRIQRACDLLRAKSRSVAAVATEVGMSNTHFSATFHDKVGISPRDYRKSFQDSE